MRLQSGIITGDSYIAGMTSLPGTALGILALGLAARERWTAAGTVGALLCFTKMVVAPIALVGALLVIQGRWRKARGFFSAAVLVGLTILAALAATGSLGPWITTQGKNSAYANGMISHGFLPGVAAQLAADGAPAWVIHLTLALTATTMTIITTTGLLAIWARHRNPLGSRVLLWMTVATVLVASLTTIWPHHRQIFYLPALVALGVATALVPAGNRRILAATMAAATVLSGFNPQLLVHDRYEFRGRLAVAASQPAEGRALASLGPTGTFARVGGPRRADFRPTSALSSRVTTRAPPSSWRARTWNGCASVDGERATGPQQDGPPPEACGGLWWRSSGVGLQPARR